MKREIVPAPGGGGKKFGLFINYPLFLKAERRMMKQKSHKI